MRKFLTIIGAILFFAFFSPSAFTQQTRVADREAEWNQLVLPQSMFVRISDPSDLVLFRVPMEWSRNQTDKLVFTGPHGASLSVFFEKIPDGVPLREYVSATMQQLRTIPEGADSILQRRTTMSALETREIMFESSEGFDEVNRRVLWSTVSGPNAINFLLIEPVANIAEIEPYFKAVVQSVLVTNQNDFEVFKSLRASIIKENNPNRVDDVQSLAVALNALDPSSRNASITKLASMFASSPDSVIDLVLDGRPMVRAAVIEAIVRSRNNSLEKLLLRALGDHEPYVAEKAAFAVASNPKVIDLLRGNSVGWLMIESVARVWPFLNRKDQIKILDEIFAQSSVTEASATRPVSKTQSSSGKTNVTVEATALPPRTTVPVNGPGSPAIDATRKRNGLTLIGKIPTSEFKLPLRSILAENDDTLTILALQTVWLRHELLPVVELLKLLSSSSNEVRRLSALNLGQSASVKDIKSIEDIINKAELAKPSVIVANPVASAHADQWFSDALRLTIKKIGIREKLSTATGEARQRLIKEALADQQITEWVWYRFVQENENASAADLKSQPASALKILPLGENLFPKDVTYYVALPKPGTALDKFAGSIDGLQLESARSQANLVLILSSLREQLALQLDSPPGLAPLVYSGINFNEPIALAKWYEEGAPHGIYSSERKAIILRVTDRARFERSLTLYQRGIGQFESLTNYVAGAVHFLTVLPGILPVAAKALLERTPTSPDQAPLIKYSFVTSSEWNGYSIKVVEQRTVAPSGHMATDAAYLTYIGDTAVLAPDLASLRDVLTRASSDRENLAANSDFKRLVESPGEVIYLSNLAQLAANPADDEVARSKKVVTESGILKISNLTWENFYQVHFNQGDWLKPFVLFQPESLASPKELLPRSTVAYFFMNFDGVMAWRDWSLKLLDLEERKDMGALWALDFEKEVLPEIGPECGVAVLGLPGNQIDNWQFPIAIFFKLKTDKLARALETGRLLTHGVAGQGIVQTKLESNDLFITVKGDYLVIANNNEAINALDNKEKLSSSRDFSRAAKQAPSDLVAFGGYNLEAAISAIGNAGADPIEKQKSALISSLASAFHSPSFYATASSDQVEGRFSLSMDREGRFSVSELASLSKDYRLTYAQVAAQGVPVLNQERLSSLKLRVRAKADGEIDRLRDDVASPYQSIEKVSDKEMLLKVLPRRAELKSNLTLPIKGAEFNAYLQPTTEIRSDDKTVIERAKEIAGEERDAWKVAQKLADWTYKNIKWKRVDNATAPQTLATLEADCLEFSQLYVAMARSLGIPARMVSGLAFSGSSFGGHAWVEVYVGTLVEVDPTWGTDFVDATHIRDSAEGALMTYASLNLIELEVLEAPTNIAEFQKDPRILTEKLCQELPKGNISALTTALDPGVLTNAIPGVGRWDTLSESERAVIMSAYQRLLYEIQRGFTSPEQGSPDFRLLKTTTTGDSAEALVIMPAIDELLIKFLFVRSNGGWFLTEIIQVDTGFHIVSELLKPAIDTIQDRRLNKTARRQRETNFARAIMAIESNPATAMSIVESALKDDPKNQPIRHIKALTLLLNKKAEEANQIWKELAGEPKPYSLALLSLAYQYANEEDVEKKRIAIDYFVRYRQLEPDDPRTYPALGDLYVETGDDVRAEVEYRGGLKSDPKNVDRLVDFAAFLALRKRFTEAITVIAEAESKSSAEKDRFGELMRQMYFTEDVEVPEDLARNQPARMAKSAVANLYLGYVRLENDKPQQAITLFKKAAALATDWSVPYEAMAGSYRTLRNWSAALAAADTAIKINKDSSEAHFQRACALANLGRTTEAVQAVEKSVELDPTYAEIVVEEPDLKALASNPAFQKLKAGLKQKQ